MSDSGDSEQDEARERDRWEEFWGDPEHADHSAWASRQSHNDGGQVS